MTPMQLFLDAALVALAFVLVPLVIAVLLCLVSFVVILIRATAQELRR